MHCRFVKGGNQWVGIVNRIGPNLGVVIYARTSVDGSQLEVKVVSDV